MESQLANLFYQMIQSFVHIFRPQVQPIFLALALAWVATPRPPRTSQLILTMGPERTSHPTTFYRFFSVSQWSADALAILLFYFIIFVLEPGRIIRIGFDDTLLKKTGPQVFGASMFRDAVLSTKKYTVKRWGLNWVVMVLALPHPLFYGEFIPIPIMARLFLTEKWCEQTGKEYKSPSQLAVEMFVKLYHVAPESLEWRLCGDGAYTNNHFLALELERVTYTGTIRHDACIQKPVETREYIGGRPPTYGLDYPKPSALAADKEVARKTVTFTTYSGQKTRRQVVELTGTYKECADERRLRFVFVLPVGRSEKVLYLATTDLESELSVILGDFVSRWCCEVCFREVKQEMGVEKSQVFVDGAVQRQTPFGLWLMGLVKVWYLYSRKVQPKWRLAASWYEPGERVSFKQMQAALRYSLWVSLLGKTGPEEAFFETLGLPLDCQERQTLILKLFCGC